MSVVTGFEALTSAYLGQDWDLFGATVDEAILNFAHEEALADVTASIAGFDELIAANLDEAQYYDRWIYGLHSGYDPRDDGYTFRDWFAHARDVLIRAAGDGHPPSASGEV